MSTQELELQLEHLEELLDSIVALVDDPDISDHELREEIRELLEVNDDDE